MSNKTFRLEIITPERVVLSEKSVTSLVAPGARGYFGVLANHAPFVAELAIGELDYSVSDGTQHEVALAGGFVEVRENDVTVLADLAELSEEIDIKRAEDALHRAEERIASHAVDVDAERARIALLKAVNRIRVASKAN